MEAFKAKAASSFFSGLSQNLWTVMTPTKRCKVSFSEEWSTCCNIFVHLCNILRNIYRHSYETVSSAFFGKPIPSSKLTNFNISNLVLPSFIEGKRLKTLLNKFINNATDLMLLLLVSLKPGSHYRASELSSQLFQSFNI